MPHRIHDYYIAVQNYMAYYWQEGLYFGEDHLLLMIRKKNERFIEKNQMRQHQIQIINSSTEEIVSLFKND